jgi:YidC/Oxa1 family membrane protein insertase
MIDTLLWPLEVTVAWIMVICHAGVTAIGLEPESGVAWGLAIAGLVVVIRVLLIPLFVRQIKAARGMQLLSPELQALQAKYKGRADPASREAMSRETMELYRKHGTNPFASCLPVLLQSPIFFALFRVLNQLPLLAAGTLPSGDRIGPLTQELASDASSATVLGAPLSSFFLQGDATTQTRVVTIGLVLLMSLTTFTTQRQLTQKNMPTSALTGPMAQQQKLLLYILPLVFAASGVNFPIGVLIYWSTTNLWSMVQQFYVIRRSPTPGSEAERRYQERRARKGAAGGIEQVKAPLAEPERTKGQRRQPLRKDRARARARQSR